MQIGTVKLVFRRNLFFEQDSLSESIVRVENLAGCGNGCSSCTEDFLVFKKIPRICSEGGKILLAGCGTVLQLLYSTVHFWSDKNDFSLSGLWHSLTCFTTDTLDLVLLSLLRLGSLSGLSYYGSVLACVEAVDKEKKGKGSSKPQHSQQPTIRNNNSKVYSRAAGANINGESHPNGKLLENGSLKEPLLSKKDSGAVKAPASFYQEWFAGSSRKDAVLLVVFLLCTGFQVPSLFHPFLTDCSMCQPLFCVMYRRRVGPEALPCFEVPRHKGSNLADRHRKTRMDQGSYPSTS